MDIISYVIGLLPAIITGLILYYVQRSQKQRDAKEKSKSDAREQEFLLMLDLQMATAKLSYATAMAIKRGSPNGEIEEGLKHYEKALDEFREFERKQLAKL